MAGKFLLQLFALLAVLAVGSLAQSQPQSSLLEVLRREGFTEFAAFLEGPAGANVLNFPTDLLVYAPTNAAFLRRKAATDLYGRSISDDTAIGENQCVPTSPGDKRSKRDAVCTEVTAPGAVDLMTLLSDPEFVNLPLGQNSSIVQKNMPKGALPVVHTGLGDVIKVTGLDIPYNKGIIRPVSGLFTLPRLLSVTLPFIGADKTLGILQRTGLIKDFDTRTGITFLAPDSSVIPPGLPDSVLAEILRRHVIVGLPVFTSDLKHGDTYKTLAGTTVTVTVQCADIFIGGARILAGDAIIKNGVAHVVDKLLEAPIFFTTTEIKTEIKTVTETATKTNIQTTEITTTATQTTEKTKTTTHTAETTKVTTQTSWSEKTKTETATTTHVQPPLPPPYPPKPSTPCTTSTSIVPLPPPPPPPTTWTSTTSVPPPPPPPPPPTTPKTSTSCTTSTTHVPPPPPSTPTPWLQTTLHTSHKPSKPHGPLPEASTPCTTTTRRGW